MQKKNSTQLDFDKRKDSTHYSCVCYDSDDDVQCEFEDLGLLSLNILVCGAKYNTTDF